MREAISRCSCSVMVLLCLAYPSERGRRAGVPGGFRHRPVDADGAPEAADPDRLRLCIRRPPTVETNMRAVGRGPGAAAGRAPWRTRCERSEEHTSELQSRENL